ncbi:hypothetical protein A2V68_01135 [candidate division Kazan bacterium RBG_13_50_9]|uniref:Uncharacterized protein n=1 Tax=candidate division Kazan bacterium RBG_13_50_9 TaxID=1798535 RepID=A0A1F4NSD7_UNCK3|nr:MAG: hypothetical protein A2V68_01135 [candidate division Kazan bacterium RBG_13_50_9]
MEKSFLDSNLMGAEQGSGEAAPLEVIPGEQSIKPTEPEEEGEKEPDFTEQVNLINLLVEEGLYPTLELLERESSGLFRHLKPIDAKRIILKAVDCRIRYSDAQMAQSKHKQETGIGKVRSPEFEEDTLFWQREKEAAQVKKHELQVQITEMCQESK